MTAQTGWQRLSPRMLLVHPVHELLRELPLLIGGLVLGSTTGNQSWTVAVIALSVGVGVARWQPSWLRYAPLSLSGLLTMGAAAGLIYQTGAVGPLQHSRLAESALEAAERLGIAATVAVIAGVVLVAALLLAVLRSLLTYGNLVLSRRADVLHLRHGLLRLRERTYDMSRLRGGTLRQPLLVRVFGGAALDAVMTGVRGVGESSVLLPPCPRSTAESVLTGLVGDSAVVTGPLRGHGRRAATRRLTRGLAIPVLIGVALAVVTLTGTSVVPLWLWTAWVAVAAWCGLLAADRIDALGHRVDSHWLVMRAGSWERRRDCLATAGIIGWTVRQSPFQRRAGVATLVAATAAGTKRYPLIDVPEDQAWAVAAQASPWVADSMWARR